MEERKSQLLRLKKRSLTDSVSSGVTYPSRSDCPITDSSLPRSTRSDSLSSDVKSPIELLEEIQQYKREEDHRIETIISEEDESKVQLLEEADEDISPSYLCGLRIKSKSSNSSNDKSPNDNKSDTNINHKSNNNRANNNKPNNNNKNCNGNNGTTGCKNNIKNLKEEQSRISSEKRHNRKETANNNTLDKPIKNGFFQKLRRGCKAFWGCLQSTSESTKTTYEPVTQHKSKTPNGRRRSPYNKKVRQKLATASLPTTSGFPGDLEITHIPTTSKKANSSYTTNEISRNGNNKKVGNGTSQLSDDAKNSLQGQHKQNNGRNKVTPPSPAPLDPGEDKFKHTFNVEQKNNDNNSLNGVQNQIHSVGNKYNFGNFHREDQDSYGLRYFEPTRSGTSPIGEIHETSHKTTRQSRPASVAQHCSIEQNPQQSVRKYSEFDNTAEILHTTQNPNFYNTVLDRPKQGCPGGGNCGSSENSPTEQKSEQSRQQQSSVSIVKTTHSQQPKKEFKPKPGRRLPAIPYQKQSINLQTNYTSQCNLSHQKQPKTSLQHSSPQLTARKVIEAEPQVIQTELAARNSNHPILQQSNKPRESLRQREFSYLLELDSVDFDENTLSDRTYDAEQYYDELRHQYYYNLNERDYLEYRTAPHPRHSPGRLITRNRYENTSQTYPRRYMGRMGSLEDHERKVIIEFCHLLEKSKQLFNGLRELPQYGHKQWHSYFGRTFDVYTKLWKFQQQHRGILDSKYGLKRWQIGEIASKIGQLYYHFYLRTSETAYLNEAFSFYYAIRGRSYYTKACKEDKCELMVKKLRYYARFIVVCLLLKKIKLVRELIKELDRQIVEYGNTYDPDDQIEWTVVVDEVKAFIQAEPVVSVIHPDSYPIILSHRLSQMTTPPVEKTNQMTLTLLEVLIVGSSTQQVKFSELTMDMFRMLQTLEREPTGDIQHMYDDSPRQRFNLTPSALNNKGYNLETGAPRCDNPHKYLLFKPSPSQILVYLASGCNDLPLNGALLLYISADGQIVPPSKHPEDIGYDIGGLITTSKNEIYRDGGSKDQKGGPSRIKEQQCLHPGDLYPFTRRPLFIIIDSDNSYVFQNIPRHFGQPLVIFMSPLEMPTSLHVSSSDRKQQGSLFTLFLHSPLTAFCHICDIHTISLVHWERAQSYIDTFMTEASQIVTRSRIDTMFLNFMGDDFLRLLIIRFIFCEVVLRMHRSFRTRTQLPRSSPPMPDELLEHPALIHIVMDLAAHLQVRANFHDPSAAGPAPLKD